MRFLTIVFLMVFAVSAWADDKAGFAVVIATDKVDTEFRFRVYDPDGFEIDWGQGRGWEKAWLGRPTIMLPAEGTDETTGTAYMVGTRYAKPGKFTVRMRGTASRVSFFGTYSTECTPWLVVDVVAPVSDGLAGVVSVKDMFRETRIPEGFAVQDWLGTAAKDVKDTEAVFEKTARRTVK